MNDLINFIFTKTPLLSALDGKKRKIGNALIVISGVLNIAQSLFPQVAVVSQVATQFGLVSGLITRVIGDVHADAKKELR